jgi:hypothetical protein
MPIEDPFLEELEASSTITTVTDDSLARGKAAEKGRAQNGTEAQGPMTASQLIMQASGGVAGEPLTPFADAGNPVMAQVRRDGSGKERRDCPCRGTENLLVTFGVFCEAEAVGCPRFGRERPTGVTKGNP